MITIQRERVIDVMEEAIPILIPHWKEAEQHIKGPKLNPDFNAYLDMENEGLLILVTARDDKRLIGYTLDVCSNDFHYKTIVCKADLVYVHPDYRNQDVFKKMIDKIEEEEVRMGATIRVMSLKTQNTKPNKLGYIHNENSFIKILGAE